MSYQVLARKWRPSRFQEMVGQEHVLKALVNALDDNRLHHAYLFTGTRGVGKTSIARLFAKSLNCETGISSQPCGACSACREIAEGRFVDLIEVDAASRTKVEDTRELLENVQYAPTHGRFKVYLIDEVHMLSTHSFNALLKTLEEPPPHVKFLLATTDPQKLPVTILSRCLQFNLKNLVPERIVGHLTHVLTEEQISFEELALWMLARAADGSMRDALSLTDQAIAFGAGQVIEADVRAMLGTIDQHLVFRIIEALASGDAAALLQTVAEVSEYSPDFSALLGDLLTVLHRLAICQTLPEGIDNSLGDEQRVRSLAAMLTAEDVQLYYQIGLNGRRDLPYVPDAREGLEMVLLRMLAFRPADAVPRPTSLKQHADPSVTPAAPAAAQPVAPTTAADVPPAAPDVSAEEPAPVKKPQAEPPVADDPPPWDTEPSVDYEDYQPAEMPAASDVSSAQSHNQPAETAVAQPHPVAPSVARQPVAEAIVTPQNTPPALVEPESFEPVPAPTDVISAAADGAPMTLAGLTTSSWVLLHPQLKLTGMTESLAGHLSLEQASNTELVFHYTPNQAAMLNETQQQRIISHLHDYFGEPVRVEFIQAAQQQETPAQHQQRLREARQLQALNALREDPVVQRIQQVFDAQINLASVTPIDPVK
ncbi:DNA polymerase III subunit gamma/tau [Pontibacter sp. JAM-7]|uniref:DNA polymerase III subunit gamma/tau n=1 Tax=Pontibacter sp. JAM-7 TaxID=3366581 RepID=UPI003AF52004